MKQFLEQSTGVCPSARQKAWFNMEMYAFIHFGVNTYTDREWGLGNEPETLFNPVDLDCDQWVEAVKAAGCTGLVLTAKHHDGFCLWPSKYTEHSVKNSPFKKDVVAMAAEACAKGGIKFGFYLSPWDRNCKLYGTPEYNDYFCNQLTELLTGYGKIFYIWFDNACGEGENGIRQEYDFDRYFQLIRKYQPQAAIFNDFGPDVRWCGNEAGTPRTSEWSVVPSELCRYALVQSGPGPLADQGGLPWIYNTDKELGALSNIMYSKGLVYCPAEIDVSIRPGWFWHPEENPRSLSWLFNTYLNSVGHNTCLNLNVPPNRNGRIDVRDVERLKEFGALLKKEFGTPYPVHISQLPGSGPTQPEYVITLDQPHNDLRYIILEEDLDFGQRVESFSITGEFFDSSKFPLYQGTTIGHKQICPLQDPFSGQNPLTDTTNGPLHRLKLTIRSARGPVHLKSIQVF